MQAWLALSWGEKLFNGSFLVAIVVILGWSFLQFINAFRKTKTEVGLSKDGFVLKPSEDGDIQNRSTATVETLKYDLMSSRDSMTPVEHRLLEIIEEQEIQKQLELTELRAQITELQSQLSDLRILLKLKEKDEETKKKNQIPLIRHEFFTEITCNIKQGIDITNTSLTKNNNYILKSFIENCVLSTYLKELQDFTTKIESEDLEEDAKISLLYSLPKEVYLWQDKLIERAKGYKVHLPDGTTLYGIPEDVISRYIMWSAKYMTFMFNKIKSIIFSSFYTSTKLRMIVILDLYSTVFTLMLMDLKVVSTDIIDGYKK